jgi:hypothetical protein
VSEGGEEGAQDGNLVGSARGRFGVHQHELLSGLPHYMGDKTGLRDNVSAW